jgi:REP element-mobilizing transposase RayT
VSNVHRLRVTDCIFFVNVNLRPRIKRFNESDYELLIGILEASRRRLGFLLCGYVLMPDHWHALIWPSYPLRIDQVLHDAKKIMTLRLHARRGTCGPALAASILGPLRAPREGIRRAPGLYAPEFREERTGEASGRLAVVELQQFRPGQSDGCSLPNSN